MKSEHVLLLTTSLLVILLIISVLNFQKAKKMSQENYTVDITGGFKNLNCGCEGDCIINY